MRHGHGFDGRRRHVAARVRELLAVPEVDEATGVDGLERPAWGDQTRRSALAIATAVVAAALLTGAWVLSSRPHADPLRTDSASSGSGLASRPSPSLAVVRASGAAAGGSVASTAAVIVVDVAGKVHRPGLYRLASGARVDDAVRAAGGIKPGVDPATVNLAARVTDGEQIVVGSPMPASGPAPSASGAAGPIDINSATLTQLEELPGVGPVLAQHIVDWREAHGAFASVDQLRSVSGIGPAKFAAIRPMVVA